MKFLIPRHLFLAAMVVLGFAFIGGATAQPVKAQTSVVTIQNYAFNPGTMTVPVGATVTWVNHDAVAHTTSSDTGVWDSGVLSPGASFSHTFTTAGVFSYHCHIHPFMQGTIIVGSAPPASTPTVSVQPATLVVGSTAMVSGTGFTPSNWAFAFWQRPDRTTNGTWVFTNGTGMFSFTLGFDPRHGTGTEFVTAFDWATQRWAPFATVSVVPGPVAMGGQLSASPNPVANSGMTTIFGSGFTPNSQVLVQWRRPDGTMGMLTVFTHGTGAFAFSFVADPRHGCGPRIFMAFDFARQMRSPTFVLNVVC